MHNVAMLADQAIHQAQTATHADPLAGVSATIRKLFILLHGSYGNAFISKFATGEKLVAGDKHHDKGVVTAMKVWGAKLSKYPSDVVEVAAGRVGDSHAEFPPSLPQFEKLCEAAMPRQTYAQEQGLVALPAPPKPEPVQVNVPKRDDGKDWARRILAREQAGDRSIGAYALTAAKQAMGLMGKQKWQ